MKKLISIVLFSLTNFTFAIELEDFPSEIIEKISSYLGFEDKAKLLLLSKKLEPVIQRSLIAHFRENVLRVDLNNKKDVALLEYMDEISKKMEIKEAYLKISVKNLNLSNMEDLLGLCKFVKGLGLSLNNLKSFEIQYLVYIYTSSENLNNLETLDLSYNFIDEHGAKAIAQSENLKNLQYLNLKNNNLSDKGAKALAESRNLQNILYLDLSSNSIHGDGLQAILSSENLPKLQTLKMSFNRIDNEEGKALDEIKLPQLKFLNLTGNDIRTTTLNLLKKRFSNINIEINKW